MEFAGPSSGWALGGPDRETILYRTTDAGKSWHRVPIPVTRPELLYLTLPQFVSSSFGVLKQQSLGPGNHVSLWVTRDGGKTWSRASAPTDQAFVDAAVNPVPFQVIDRNHWIAAVNGGVLFLTGDAGRTWTRTDVGAPWTFGILDSIQFPALDEGWIVSCGIHSEQALCAKASLILVLHGGTVWTSAKPSISKPAG